MLGGDIGDLVGAADEAVDRGDRDEAAAEAVTATVSAAMAIVALTAAGTTTGATTGAGDLDGFFGEAASGTLT